MRVQIATVHAFSEHVFRLEKIHRSDHVILVIENNLDDSERQICEDTINAIKQVYSPLDIPVEVLPVDPTDVSETVRCLGLQIRKLPEKCSIILNVSGGRRFMGFALLFAAYLVHLSGDYQIILSIAPENMDLVQLPLPPAYIPDKIDLKILHGIIEQQSVANLGDMANITQPSASARLKKLANHGYVTILGRKRTLTALGVLTLEIISPDD